MAYTVAKVEIWTGEIEDQPGGLAAKLEALANAGADLDVVIARRQPGAAGKGVVFLGPVSGARAKKAAAGVGLTRTSELVALRVEGPNKPGEGHRLARLLADAGLNLRGLSASVLGNKFVMFVAFDNDADATKAARLLRGAGAKRKAAAKA
jgi:hypothetical protein